MRNLSSEHFDVSKQWETDVPVNLRSLLFLGKARLVGVRSEWRENASKTEGVQHSTLLQSTRQN